MNKKGFTLVELIIVIAIIAILAGAIFVAIDPARRLHESRNSRRASDINTILSAIRLHQVDSNGELFTTVAAMTNDLHYQIGPAGDGCARTCAGATIENACVDLSGIGSNYLSTVPEDPLTAEDGLTAYMITKDANGAITIQACDAEAEGPGGAGDVPVITVSN